MPVADGLVVRNVAAQARPPRARRVEMHTWTAEQLGTFLAAVRAEPKRAKGRRSLILASLDTYSQVIPSLQQEAASVVAAAVLDPATSTAPQPSPKGQVRAITSGS
jgi:predicted alpha/beta hydrolase family esterase